MRFAIFNHEGGPIPDNATIQSATLSIYKFSPYDGTIQVNRLLKGWQETSVTWDSPWTIPGAQDATDIHSPADGSGTLTDWSPGWLNINVTPGVQAFAQGANNYGWRLAKNGVYGLSFYSKEHADLTLRPKLTVTYTSHAQVQDGIYYIHTDHLNTPRIITDTTNKIVWRWNSDPFGTTAANEDPDNDGTTFTFNLRFPGQYFDKESNLHYNYFRDYNPATGRYVQSDPIGLLAGVNTYGYVGGNPVSYFDPLGLSKCACTADLYSKKYPGPGGPNPPRSWKKAWKANVPIQCNYECTKDDGTKATVVATHVAQFWFESDDSLSCLNVDYERQYQNAGPGYFREISVPKVKSFDPEGSGSPELEAWAKKGCESCTKK